MDMSMYNLIKNAMKEGKSTEDIIAEVNALTKTAEKELKPETPIKDRYSKLVAPIKDADGKISRDGIITALACYFVQLGFEPDSCVESEGEFRSGISEILNSNYKALKQTSELIKLKKSGASNREWARAFFDSINDIIGDMF